MKVEAKQSTLEDWQKEARKLELQDKQEQAEAIRRGILRQTPVTWPVLDEAKVRELLVKVFREEVPGGKLRQQLYEYAACHDEPMLADWLLQEARFDAARNFAQQLMTLGRKTYVPYFAPQFKDILRQCERHGLEHRLPMNQTPLMAAAAAGNVALVEALLERGADRDAVDHYGWNAMHWAMRETFRDPKFARGPFAALYELLAPSAIDVNTGDRLVRIDRHLSEYFLFQTLWVLFKSRFSHRLRWPYAAFETRAILDAWRSLPANVVRPERNKRPHLSGVLARNEVERDYAYNRGLFLRVKQGWYQFNPKLSVRRRVGEGEQTAAVGRSGGQPAPAGERTRTGRRLGPGTMKARPPTAHTVWAYTPQVTGSSSLRESSSISIRGKARWARLTRGPRRASSSRSGGTSARARARSSSAKRLRHAMASGSWSTVMMPLPAGSLPMASRSFCATSPNMRMLAAAFDLNVTNMAVLF